MACIRVPRHPTCDENFITIALKPVALRHDSLLELVANVSAEDPLAALRLLQVCGINRYGQILSAVPHASLATFCDQRDTTVTEAFGDI
jgi:hypothetical protein